MSSLHRLNSEQLNSHKLEVPLGTAAGGLGVLLRSGLVPVGVAILRFACWTDVTGAVRARLLVSDAQRGTSIEVGLRNVLVACLLRFLMRLQFEDRTAAVDDAVWEWSEVTGALIYRGKCPAVDEQAIRRG